MSSPQSTIVNDAEPVQTRTVSDGSYAAENARNCDAQRTANAAAGLDAKSLDALVPSAQTALDAIKAAPPPPNTFAPKQKVQP